MENPLSEEEAEVEEEVEVEVEEVSVSLWRSSSCLATTALKLCASFRA